jgi:cephalosporin hydroxylase
VPPRWRAVALESGMFLSSNARKLVGVLLVLFAAAFPVFLYDRLVARELLRRRHEPPPTAEVVELYHRAFYYAAQTTPMYWLGVPTIQNPNDVWVTQELISRLKPDFIVETGTWHGGSALIWAMVQDQVNPGGRVITIDIQRLVDEATLPPIWSRKVDSIVGSSTDPEVVADVARRVGKGRVMVLLDSDHSAPHVLAEMRAYGPLVSVDSYLIVQDTNINGHPVLPNFGPGPMEAVVEFLREDDRFQVDRTQERLLFTMHPSGYLKRVK